MKRQSWLSRTMTSLNSEQNENIQPLPAIVAELASETSVCSCLEGRAD